jgi:hypothetical protein
MVPVFLFLILSGGGAAADSYVPGEWTWSGGSTLSNSVGVYGSMVGATSPSYWPGARIGASIVRTASGTVWLFGGSGYGAAAFGYLNDLWKWDGTTWTWMSGVKAPNQAGTYGSIRVASALNMPGGRGLATLWADNSGNLWLLGGFGWSESAEGPLNDLWKWDPAASLWTWMAGAKAPYAPAVYGTPGVPSSLNTPGGRYDAGSALDASGNLWLFGGEAAGNLSDLWRWDGSNWTWMGGSSSTNQFGVYGTPGMADAGNRPGGRTGMAVWRDLAGAFWVFGGSGYGESGAVGDLNDLWRFDGQSWTWMKGPKTPNQSGSYGVLRLPASTNLPPCRSEAASWMDAAGDTWLFGGSRLGDVWKWDGTNFTWMSGPSTPNPVSVYGTRGVADPSNAPGGRTSPAVWRDPSTGLVWSFGGYGLDASSAGGYLNDLWAFDTSAGGSAVPVFGPGQRAGFALLVAVAGLLAIRIRRRDGLVPRDDPPRS